MASSAYIAKRLGQCFISRKLLSSQFLSKSTYLSQAYCCDQEWNELVARDPLLQNVDTEQSFVQISKKLLTKTKENLAVDVDIFVNTFKNAAALDELDSVLNRFRRSKHTARTLPSTPYATIRFMLSHGFDKQLVEMLENHYGYGIFPDVHTSNMLLNHFLTKSCMEREAAKIAAEMMLQEEPGNEISRTLGPMACLRYLLSDRRASPWVSTGKSESEKQDDDDEEIFVRVPNLTNPWFDDHFDLCDNADQLLGKTLLHFADFYPPGAVQNSLWLVGLAYRARWTDFKEKVREVTEVCSDITELCSQKQSSSTLAECEASVGPHVERSMVETSENESAGNNGKEGQFPPVPAWVIEDLNTLKKIDVKLMDLLEKEAKNLSLYETRDIEQRRLTFADWAATRADAFAENQAAKDRARRIEIIRAKKKELVEQQELYYVFENWHKVEMLLDEVEKNEVKEDSVVDYVPPEVNKPLLQREE